MIDNSYKNSFKEVFDILQYTENELVEKIPSKFMDFIETNMNTEYPTNLNLQMDLDKQHLLKETEAILALIYRSYWATDTEKQEFALKDKQEAIEKKKTQKENYNIKNIEQIFEERKNINKITLDNHLMVIQKESFFRKILKKISNLLHLKANH